MINRRVAGLASVVMCAGRCAKVCSASQLKGVRVCTGELLRIRACVSVFVNLRARLQLEGKRYNNPGFSGARNSDIC
jgi:hypothetical protein